MIRKGIASILIILILINSIGCYSYSQIKKEDTEKIEEYGEAKITTIDDKVYILTDVEIQESILKGYGQKDEYLFGFIKYRGVKEVVIPIDQIKKIEIKSPDTGLTVLAIIIIIGIPVGLVLYLKDSWVRGMK
jgi:hypothetical protein